MICRCIESKAAQGLKQEAADPHRACVREPSEHQIWKSQRAAFAAPVRTMTKFGSFFEENKKKC